MFAWSVKRARCAIIVCTLVDRHVGKTCKVMCQIELLLLFCGSFP